MDDFDSINATCKLCGGNVKFASHITYPGGRHYDIEDPDIPYDVIEATDCSIVVCSNCGTELQLISSVSAWVNIVKREAPKL